MQKINKSFQNLTKIKCINSLKFKFKHTILKSIIEYKSVVNLRMFFRKGLRIAVIIFVASSIHFYIPRRDLELVKAQGNCYFIKSKSFYLFYLERHVSD